ncbi:filamentous hemagglutinin N-terminal domain-containing protein [Oscillatoria sp. CS-180]|uniref:two-partner secretion domain-containing protein n=1 Tax=Oscillatoria sp. CS-180 TaxID=3021720 RepID=UPI00232E7986|nr:filamentous hemagglutinin N-terminal domain-containing protein [Oscillatoria sp. CS-180]MDB9525046.1 filamentous hemagglutinin N-terminal domain-containing protein [Oscillatoria sp. CS-180]
MATLQYSKTVLVGLGGCSLLVATDLTQAMPVVPEAGSQTQVIQAGDEFSITGGVTSADGQSLFYMFEQFGLSQGQTADFTSQPTTQAVLGSVTGGNASYIDGLLRVSGSSADLYLINPAGVFFGPNIQLDLPASFAAATASGVLFGEDLFETINSRRQDQLVGTPTGFVFAADASGQVVNTGNMTVLPGEAIALIGGQVISTGTLATPSGEIVIAAVPNSNLVRISHTDMVLNLEIETLPHADASLPFVPSTLAELLTGGETAAATGLAVTPEGLITLANVEIADVVGSALVSNTLDASGVSGGDVMVVGDRVSLVEAKVDASGTLDGGNIRIGGDPTGQGTLPGSTLTYVDGDSVIAANGRQTGDGGSVTIWSDGVAGVWGDISAQGGALSGDGGWVEVSGRQSLIFRGTVTTSAPGGLGGELLLDPVNIAILNGTADGDDSDDLANLLSAPTLDLAEALPTEIYESELEGLSGNTAITLQASGDIAIADLDDNQLTFQTGTAPIRFEAGGTFTMHPDDVLVAPGRDLSITTGGSIAVGDIFTYEVPDNTDGSITLMGADIDAGVLNALQVTPITTLGNDGNTSQVSLESTRGDIIVESILSGSGGVVVNSAGRFRAEGVVDVAARPEKADPALVDDFTLSILAAVPLNDEEDVSTAALPQSDTELFLLDRSFTVRRGERVSADTVRGIAIAFDIENLLPPLPIEFWVGPDSGGGSAVPLADSGAAGGIFRTRPDRTIVTSFENQIFLIDSNVLIDTTALDTLSDLDADTENERATQDTSGTSAETVLAVCDKDAEISDPACEE